MDEKEQKEQKIALDKLVEMLFGGEREHVQNLPKDDPLRAKAIRLGDAFTEAVRFLKVIVPNPTINKLGSLLWDIVGNQVIPVAIGPDVKTLSVAGYKQGTTIKAEIIVPLEWEKMWKEDTLMQMGAVVYTGSKAIDIFNGKLDSSLMERAKMYEAEFLLTALKDVPDADLNDYQKEVVASFPQGIKSKDAKKLLYEWRPFSAARA